jgi:hypothetical protein
MRRRIPVWIELCDLLVSQTFFFDKKKEEQWQKRGRKNELHVKN